ncbi:unnamed protein product [Arabidopsis halleri]
MTRGQSYYFLGIVTIYFFFCLLPLPNTFASPTRSQCRRDQRDALLELQKEFPIHSNNMNSVTTVLWNTSVDCCSWHGVKCDANLGKVISLHLYSFSTVNTSLKSSSGLFKLRHLRRLGLSGNLQGEIPSSFGNLLNLTSLDLSNCNFHGEIPSAIGNLSNLKFLGLSHNQLVGEIPSTIGNLSHLASLDLSHNQLVGEIPSSIGNFFRLTYLDLSNNQLEGEVPASIGNLNQLESMPLWANHLRGNIPTSFANLTKLSELKLLENQFTGGDIVLSNLTSLSIIDLSSNHFKSSIFPYLSGLHNLERFFGDDNSFVGPFPSSLLPNPSLITITLSQNKLEGAIDFGNTSSSYRLESLNVGDNNLDGLIPESISTLVNLKELDLSHNNLGGRVPRSISKLVNLNSMDLSYNKLEGQVPQCFWRSSKLDFVDLSHNSFNDFGKSVEVFDGASLTRLYLSSNTLQVPIPHWICKLSLSALDLSNNQFIGSIPQCLKSLNFQNLNLRNNSLTGILPDLCINGNQLGSLDISGNNLVGKLPKSWIYCSEMEFLNVRRNKIKDTFPFWLGRLPQLKVLGLGSNAFYGPIYNASAYLGFPSLRIMDISNNNFVGSLTQDYFANWTEMSLVWNGSDVPNYMMFRYTAHTSDYMIVGYSAYNSIDLVYKGVDTDFARIFKDFKAIDFSGNRFSGHIPGSIGLMSELRLLNLSGNAFTGNIPPSMTNMKNLETLDLSRNNLSGEIPQGLGKLTFLSNINFSYNHLEGLVPQSTQFKSQNCSSFMGNSGLYGLEEICRESHHVPAPTSQQPEELFSEPDELVLNWIAAAIAFGPGVFCGLVIGYIFTSYKHEWFILSR